MAACGGDDDDDTAARPDGDGEATSLPPDLGDVGDGDPTDLPDDACQVFPADQVEALVPGARVDGPKNLSQGGSATAGCSWANDTRTLSLNYSAGIPHDLLLTSMESDTKDANGELTQIGGADAGIVVLAVTGDLEINMVQDDVLIGVRLLTIDGPANTHRDGLVGLAEAAVGSL